MRKANEFLYRRVDIEDVVSAHLLAGEARRDIGFARYIVSATTPFGAGRSGRIADRRARPSCARYVAFDDTYAGRGWSMFPVDRPRLREPARPRGARLAAGA